MGFSLIPKDEGFFDLFDESAGLIVRVTETFGRLITQFDKPVETAAEIKELESKADDITRRTYEALDRSFLTPLEPEDIHALAGALDDLVDAVEEAAFRFATYLHGEKPTPPAAKMAGIIADMGGRVAKAVKLLRKGMQGDEMRALLREIPSLERQADGVFREAFAGLFASNSADPLPVIKWKDLYERLEEASDASLRVADVIQEIVLKTS
jgi:predicted phosphate transport protein (TIGR00153 family)